MIVTLALNPTLLQLQFQTTPTFLSGIWPLISLHCHAEDRPPLPSQLYLSKSVPYNRPRTTHLHCRAKDQQPPISFLNLPSTFLHSVKNLERFLTFTALPKRTAIPRLNLKMPPVTFYKSSLRTNKLNCSQLYLTLSTLYIGPATDSFSLPFLSIFIIKKRTALIHLYLPSSIFWKTGTYWFLFTDSSTSQ